MLPSFKPRSLTLICRRTITTHSHYHHGDISEGTAHTNPQRKPSRGGQSLSSRWTRLEKSIRQKASLSQELEDLTAHDASLPEVLQPRTASKPKTAPLFYGFVVPEEPKPPVDDGKPPLVKRSLLYSIFPRVLHVRMRRLRLRPPRGVP